MNVFIVVTEDPGDLPIGLRLQGPGPGSSAYKFSEKVAELRKSDPLVDWGELKKGDTEVRRVVKFPSQSASEGRQRPRA
jgi:hypothetical protein